MQLYRLLACGSVLLQAGPALWVLKWLGGSKADSFTYVALPGLWTFLFGAATVVALLWEHARGVVARIILAGQILGMVSQMALATLFVARILPTQLEFSAVPMLIGQAVVLTGLLWQLGEKTGTGAR